MNSTPAAQALLSPSDIAKMAGVSAAAVSNWRKRAHNFPEPTGGSETRPLFGRDAVIAWLQTTGKATAHSPESDALAALNMLTESRRSMLAPPSPLKDATAILALMCAKKFATEDTRAATAWQEFLNNAETRGLAPLHGVPVSRWNEIVDVEELAYGDDPTAIAAVGRLIERIPAEALANAADAVLTRTNATTGRGGSEIGYINSKVSTFLARIAHEDAHGTILDPASGLGDVLTQLYDLDVHRRIELMTAYDISLPASVVADQRGFLRDMPLELHAHDVLADDFEASTCYDLVVAEPPFGLQYANYDLTDPRWAHGIPPFKSSEMAWIQHVIYHLTDEGTGFVVTPLGPLFHSGAVERIRRSLVDAGCVRAVYQLPPKLLPHTSLPLAVWVLGRPGSADSIRFVHANSIEGVTDRATFEAAHPSADVSIEDVLAGEALLLPERWIGVDTPDPTIVASDYTDAHTRTAQAVAATPRDTPSPFAPASVARIVTVAELVDQNLVKLRRGRAKGDDTADLRLVRPGHIVDGRLVTLQTDVPQGLAMEDEGYNPALTLPGDVLLSTTGRLAAAVDPDGGHLLSSTMASLRVATDQVLPPYLAAVLVGAWNLRFSTGSALMRIAPKDLEVPLVPVSEQQKVVDAIEQMRAIKRSAETLAAAADETIHHLTSLVRWNQDTPSD